jgi:hypothetical protein
VDQFLADHRKGKRITKPEMHHIRDNFTQLWMVWMADQKPSAGADSPPDEQEEPPPETGGESADFDTEQPEEAGDPKAQSPEMSERDAKWAEIVAANQEDEIEFVQNRLGLAVGIHNAPPSIDGCIVVEESLQDLKKQFK